MSSRNKKRKHSAAAESVSSVSIKGEPYNYDQEVSKMHIQKLRIKPMPELPPREEVPPSKKKHSHRHKEVPPPLTSSISPTGDDGGLKMKFILSPKDGPRSEISPGSDTKEDVLVPKEMGKGKSKEEKKKEEKLKAKLVFKDQVLTLDGEKVTHTETPCTGKKRKLNATSSPETFQTPEPAEKLIKKKKGSDKSHMKEEPQPKLPPFTKVPKSAEKAKLKSLKVESDSGYSDTPTTAEKSKKLKTKLQTVEEYSVPSPQPVDTSKDAHPKKKKKDKEKKKKKMFRFKGDRNRFLNVRDSSDDDDSFTRSMAEDESPGGSSFYEEDRESSSKKKEKSKKSKPKSDSVMMPQPAMPVPDYNLEKQAMAKPTSSAKAKAKKDDLKGKENRIQSSRAEDLISQLTANGTEMETVYPSYMQVPEDDSDEEMNRLKKKKKKKLGKDKKKKKKFKIKERDEHGKPKYFIRKTVLSGYMLWCREYRSTFVADNPGLDFSEISRGMGALWQTLPDQEKHQWRKRQTTVTTRVSVNRKTKHEKAVAAAAAAASAAAIPAVIPTVSKVHKKVVKRKNLKKKPTRQGPPKWQPIDCAAHLKLLGESLSDVGTKLQLHPGNIEVHGSVSVLLDSLLCALGPLMCLTSQVPRLEVIPKKTKTGILDNVAYIMPGL